MDCETKREQFDGIFRFFTLHIALVLQCWHESSLFDSQIFGSFYPGGLCILLSHHLVFLMD